MPRAEVGTPKYLANAMKSKGLQKLRWYCQVCQKQCRDDNGFKCHLATESHLRQMLVVGESAGKHISDFSMQFQSEFVRLLSTRFGTNRVKANNVYQEFIQDKHHLHMNSTRWMSLSEFVKHLGRGGIVRVDETDKGLFIAWVDNSPKALAKAEASMKKERMTMSDEQRERVLIEEQIERAKAEAGEPADGGSSSEEAESSATGLQREEGGAPLKLSFGLKKTEGADGGDSPASAATPQPAPVKFNVFKTAAVKPAATAAHLKPANIFKTAAKSSTGSSASASAGPKRHRDDSLSVAERLMQEDQERKRRRMGVAN